MFGHFAGTQPENLFDLGGIGYGNGLRIDLGQPPTQSDSPGGFAFPESANQSNLHSDLFETLADQCRRLIFSVPNPSARKTDRPRGTHPR